MLIKYVRNENGSPIGAVVAIGANKVGWSLCCKKDRWNKKMGISIAFGRAKVGSHADLPVIVKPFFNQMQERSQRYFKDLSI